jgi:hypothetical protein
MAPITPTSLPSAFTAGTTWRWDETHDDFPVADGWTLTRRFVGAGYALSVAATAGTTHEFAATAAVTALVPAGDYQATGWATLDGATYPLSPIAVTVAADPSTLAPGYHLTHNERVLNAIRCRLEGRFTADVESYSIAGRSISKIPATELVKLEGVYAQRVRIEKGQPFGRTIAAHFMVPR